MSLPKNSAASSMLYGIVVGGDKNDPDPAQAGACRVYFPTLYGPNVKPKDLAFSPRIMSPSRSAMQEFPGGLDTGTMVVALKDTGSNRCQILGLAADLNNRDSSIAGNNDLLQNLSRFFSQSMGINVPPNMVEATERGARVRKVQEKGQEHNHDLLRGLPTHGALFPLAGTRLPQIQNIATAVQAFTNILTADPASQIPGSVMSLGKMMNLLNSTGLMKEVTKNLPREVTAAIGSMGVLMQSIETKEGAGFSTGGRVDETTFLNNAVQLLSQSTNLSDVVSAMSRLQTDSSLFGQDNLADVEMEIDTPFGKVPMSLDYNGNITTKPNDTIVKAVQAFVKLMGSPTGFPGVNSGENVFGASAETMFNMFQRLPQSKLTEAVRQATQLNQSGVAQNMDKIVKEVVNGGNPLKLLG